MLCNPTKKKCDLNNNDNKKDFGHQAYILFIRPNP